VVPEGVNEKLYDRREHHVISNAWCTTNSLAPAVKVLNDAFGIGYVMVTTVHVYTASQALLDRAARKLRRGHAAAASTRVILSRVSRWLCGTTMNLAMQNAYLTWLVIFPASHNVFCNADEKPEEIINTLVRDSESHLGLAELEPLGSPAF
jgi:hypothetical protein